MSNPFTPLGDSVKVAATIASDRVAFPVQPETIRVYNGTAAVAFIAFGGAGVVAATDGNESLPVAAGATEVFGGGSITHAAVVLSAGSGDVWFTPGAGI